MNKKIQQIVILHVRSHVVTGYISSINLFFEGERPMMHGHFKNLKCRTLGHAPDTVNRQDTAMLK